MAEEKIEVPKWLSLEQYCDLDFTQKLVFELLTDENISKETAIKILYLAPDC